MMRIDVLLAVALLLPLAGCAPPAMDQPVASPPMSSDPVPEPEPANRCEAGLGQWAVGRFASEEVIDKVVRDTGSSIVRMVRPGEPVTDDYSAQRVNVFVDASGAVAKVECY